LIEYDTAKEFAMKNWIQKHQLSAFFFLTYLIMFGVMFAYIYFYPNQPLQQWSLVWFFSIFSPSISALIVTGIIGGMPEIKRLLGGFTRWQVGLRWYFWAAFLILGPLAITLIYKALGNQSEGIMPGETISSMAGIIVFTLFSGPIAEELGWRGFALPRLQEKYNALVSSLILGVIWTCWHIPFFFTTGATQMSIPFPIYLVLVVTSSIYLTWLYNNTNGSLIVTILGHFTYNLTGFLTGVLRLMPAMLFYMTAGPLLALVVAAVVFIYGPRYLSRKPVAELPFQPKLAAAVNGDYCIQNNMLHKPVHLTRLQAIHCRHQI
jgi:membrane protease YdiL (CAAX protease family)